MRSDLVRRLGRCLLMATVCAVAACTSASGHAQPSGSARASGQLQVPGCSTQVVAGSRLSARRPALVSVPGDPTGAAASPDGRWAFAALSQNGDGGDPRLAVLAIRKVAGGQRLALVRVITLPPPLTAAWGMSISPDGRLLLVAGGSGTAVLSLSKVVSGAAHPVLGVLTDGGLQHSRLLGLLRTTTPSSPMRTPATCMSSTSLWRCGAASTPLAWRSARCRLPAGRLASPSRRTAC